MAQYVLICALGFFGVVFLYLGCLFTVHWVFETVEELKFYRGWIRGEQKRTDSLVWAAYTALQAMQRAKSAGSHDFDEEIETLSIAIVQFDTKYGRMRSGRGTA